MMSPSRSIDEIRDACSKYITGPLLQQLNELLGAATQGRGLVEVDTHDDDRQSLLIRYPSVLGDPDSYVAQAVRLEAGAKSALDPNEPRPITPYVATELPSSDLTVDQVTTIIPVRTFWDKVVIAHGECPRGAPRAQERAAGRVMLILFIVGRLLQTAAWATSF